MTEEEAKTKWCPYVRYVETNSETAEVASPAYNRVEYDEIPPVLCCIGSACMAWRWLQPGHDPDLPRQFPDVIGSELNKRRDIGFCGLAGKP